MTGGAADELRTLLPPHSFEAWHDSDCENWVLAHGEAALALIEAAQLACEAYPGSSSNRIVRKEMHSLAAAVSRLTEPQT